MATYIDRDIETTFAGDIVLDGRGDIKIANALETYKSAANFVLRTDFGDYAPQPTVGCNLGSFIGQPNNSESHEQMEYLVNKVLQQELFTLTDARADVVPFDINEALCVVSIAGNYLVDGEIKNFNAVQISYQFPFIDGNPTPLVVS